MNSRLVMLGLALIVLGLLAVPSHAATAVHVESSLAGSPIFPAMQGNKSTIYPSATFYLYSDEHTNYSIALQYSPNGSVEYLNGTIEGFSAVRQVDLSGRKLVWLCTVRIGTDVYTFERVLIMHNAILEDEIKQREKREVISKDALLKGKLQTFTAALFAGVLASLGLAWYLRKREEDKIDELL